MKELIAFVISMIVSGQCFAYVVGAHGFSGAHVSSSHATVSAHESVSSHSTPVDESRSYQPHVVPFVARSASGVDGAPASKEKEDPLTPLIIILLIVCGFFFFLTL